MEYTLEQQMFEMWSTIENKKTKRIAAIVALIIISAVFIFNAFGFGGMALLMGSSNGKVAIEKNGTLQYGVVAAQIQRQEERELELKHQPIDVPPDCQHRINRTEMINLCVSIQNSKNASNHEWHRLGETIFEHKTLIAFTKCKMLLSHRMVASDLCDKAFYTFHTFVYRKGNVLETEIYNGFVNYEVQFHYVNRSIFDYLSLRYSPLTNNN